MTLEKALYKAFEASYLHLPTFGNVIFTIHDDTKEEALDLARRFDAIGYGIYATEGTAKFLNEHGVHATLVNKLGENDDNDIPALVRTGKAPVSYTHLDVYKRQIESYRQLWLVQLSS